MEIKKGDRESKLRTSKIQERKCTSQNPGGITGILAKTNLIQLGNRKWVITDEWLPGDTIAEMSVLKSLVIQNSLFHPFAIFSFV